MILLFVYERFNDVRWHIPPSSIGKFGEKLTTDVLRRHTGDFPCSASLLIKMGSLLSIQHNIPYILKYFAPVSNQGMQEDDCNDLGNPGLLTATYFLSIKTGKNGNSACIEMRGVKQELKKFTADEAINIAYANKYARSSNTEKYIGMNNAIRKLDDKRQGVGRGCKQG